MEIRAEKRVGGIVTLPTAEFPVPSSAKNRVGGIEALPTSAMADSLSAKDRAGGFAASPETSPEDGIGMQRKWMKTYSVVSVTTGSGEGRPVDGTATGSIVTDKETPPHETMPKRTQCANREVAGRSGIGQWRMLPFQRRAEEWGRNQRPRWYAADQFPRRAKRTCQGADLIWERLLRPPHTCPCFPEFGIDVEAEMAQSGMRTMKKESTATVCQARGCAAILPAPKHTPNRGTLKKKRNPTASAENVRRLDICIGAASLNFVQK